MADTRIHVGPDEDEAIRGAVERAGGTLAEPDGADGIVWLGGPDDLRPRLNDGVRWVQLPSAGVENWVSSGILDDRRTWTSAVGAYAPQVAEHALALVLATARRLGETARLSHWEPLFGRTLKDATVAIVGAGGIGQALIPMLAPLGVRIVAVTRSGREVPGADESLSTEELGDLWPRADVVVVAAPATAATRHLIDAEALRALPAHALLVNVARGSLIDTDALVAALRDGEIGAAGLDVTDPEPLPDGHPLWEEPRALITPHTANPPEAMNAALAARVRDNVARFASGEELLGVVDPERAY